MSVPGTRPGPAPARGGLTPSGGASRDSVRLACGASRLLASLSHEPFDALAHSGFSRAYVAGERVAQGGRPWPYVALVNEGELEAVKESPEGRALIPWALAEGDLFWGAFAREDSILPVSLRARTPLVITLWSREEFLAAMEMDPRTLRPLCREMAAYMARAAECIERLAFHPLRARLAHLLLATYRPTPGSSRKRFLTLDQMAERLGTTREVVCRLLKSFADEGWLEATRSELRFHDVESLRTAAGDVAGPCTSAQSAGRRPR